ncbi:mitogen-activated protein kinase kinase kinase 4-like, partial [Hyposmocoma kahamanoa]|uniref:mitogen-activated protein kinase kinase kinase 4-like n=1 Tax=Hyposmocoma kahamanoa TaxID=1477025 RepID=UPI000E6D7E47
AMCLWYNTALNMRLKVLAVRKMLRTLKSKNHRRVFSPFASTDSDVSRQSVDQRQCTVRFNVSSTPTDSNNSDSSHSDHKESSDETSPPGDGETNEEEKGDEVDNGKVVDGQRTPEIVISDSNYGTSDTTASSESGYSTTREHDAAWSSDDVFDVGNLEELTQLRLLGKCAVSPYRVYHQEMLKTQGIRRCMQFMNKMRSHVLNKAHRTLEKPDTVTEEKTDPLTEDDPAEVFDDTKEEEEKKESEEDEEAKKTYELRRYGCCSEESLAMRLPSYRSHLLLLNSVCMEAVHDYLTLRLEDRPANPSCLTVKQLIHELKEGLDIALETRTAYARNIEVLLAGNRAADAVRRDLLLLVRTFDASVETVLKEYLSYLRTMSLVEPLPRNALQQEWAFSARLARHLRPAAAQAPLAFSEIACNQLERIKNQFEWKFKQLDAVDETAGGDASRHVVYALCREAQHIYASEREAALQAAQWARQLAARLQRAPPPAFVPQRGAIFRSLMRLRDSVVAHTREIVWRSAAVQAPPPDGCEADAAAARVRELLLQAHRLGFELHKELYRFAQAPFQLQEEKCSKKRPVSLQPIRPKATDTRRRRPETMIINESVNPMIHKELHRFVNESPGRGSPPGTRRVAGSSPPRVSRFKFFRSESISEDVELANSVLDDRFFDNIHNFGDNQVKPSLL